MIIVMLKLNQITEYKLNTNLFFRTSSLFTHLTDKMVLWYDYFSSTARTQRGAQTRWRE